MKIKLQRRYFGDTYTIGSLFVNHTYFCDTLEDKVRELPGECPYTPKWQPCKCEEKVYGQTAIPSGKYIVTLQTSPKFKRKLPVINNVPHFLGILIHRGRLPEHTEGCIIVGENRVKGQVLASEYWEKRLVELIADALTRGEVIEIEIV